jgi:arsenical pump membrane protein
VIVSVLALALVLVIAVAWRNRWAPAAGALAGVAAALAGGAAEVDDLSRGLAELWRPAVGIVGIMLTTACAAEVGIFTRIAAAIEPRTRGPVRVAFRFVFVVAALTAAALSNDAAILLLTPIVIELLRTVYPKRNPKFLVPFAFAVFVAAGVAPLPTSNPMNFVVAHRAGMSFNSYAAVMIPVAIVGWLVAYRVLAAWFRDALADVAPALGDAPPRARLGGHAIVVLAVAGTSIAAYPVLAALHAPIWPVAALAGVGCAVTVAHARGDLARVVDGVSWELVPFLFGVMVLAIVLARGGATAQLAHAYAATPAPLATVGAVGALGSALVGNHAMALVHSQALAGGPPALVLAALVGGDLGPRLLPIGSLAGLIWIQQLRRQGVALPLRTFVGVGLVVTVPSLLASLATLWLLAGR